MEEEMEAQLAPLRLKVKEQGDIVRQMKATGAADIDIKKEVAKLKALRKDLEDMTLKLDSSDTFDRAKMADLVKRKFFYEISFAIYGGITGQFEYGNVGYKIIYNLLDEWRKHFVFQEDMLEISCTTLTPEPVLAASGHVDKFADYMVKDLVTGECYRLDHLIKLHLEKKLNEKNTSDEVKKEINGILSKLDGLTVDELGALVTKYEMKAPATGNGLTPPVEFNLMFPINIGPSGEVKGFLRPETAQGIFVNFKKLLEQNQGSLPFAVAQIGNAYRNEISPRAGLLRVREFTMAEIEHFCFPDDKSHPKFESVADEVLTLYSSRAQESGESPKKMSIGEAVRGNLVANETLGYYMARIQQYLLKVGIQYKKLRFRQHMENEMAHYACDCWDAECLTSYGWIECVGCADRSAYDLTCHSKATGTKLSVERLLSEPKVVDSVTPVLDKGLVGKTFKKEAKDLTEKLAALSVQEVETLDKSLSTEGTATVPGSSYQLTRAMVPSIKRESKKVHVEDITPNVIEPSFGIGRIFYSLLEHTFTVRENDDQRTYFQLPTIVTPIKVSVLPLSNKPEFAPFTKQISEELKASGISVKVDASTGSIGRRYARTDELAIPFAVTIDFDTVSTSSVTLRERDSTEQVRIPVSLIVSTVTSLTSGGQKWSDVVSKYPKFTQQETTK